MNIKVNGLSVNTFGDNKNQSIIFVHGFPYDYTMWQNQIDTLKEKYFCVAYDVRGLGQSDIGDGQYTMEMYVDDLFAVIEKLKLNKSILCGLSLGGYIAFRAVEKSQKTFGGVIFCDTRSEGDDNAGRLKRSGNISQINKEGVISFTDPFIMNCFSDETQRDNPKLIADTIEKAHKNNPVGVKGAIIAIMSRTDTTEFLPNIEIPAMVLCGSFDKLTPPPVMRSIAEKIPGSEIAIIPHAGHMSPLENPSCVNDLIAGFMKKIS